jgi:hypothetical protein
MIQQNTCEMYFREHMIRSNGMCVKCCLHRRSFVDIDLSDPSILAVEGMEVVVSSGRSIAQAVERAYLNPQYSMCRKRLCREFDELCNYMSGRRGKDV